MRRKERQQLSEKTLMFDEHLHSYGGPPNDPPVSQRCNMSSATITFVADISIVLGRLHGPHGSLAFKLTGGGEQNLTWNFIGQKQGEGVSQFNQTLRAKSFTYPVEMQSRPHHRTVALQSDRACMGSDYRAQRD